MEQQINELPHIQELFNVFSRYNIAAAKAGWKVKEFKVARDTFKEELTRLGIANKFRWDGVDV